MSHNIINTKLEMMLFICCMLIYVLCIIFVRFIDEPTTWEECLASHLSVYSAELSRVTAWSKGLELLAARSLHSVVQLALPPVLHNSLEAILLKCTHLTDLSVVVRKRPSPSDRPKHAAQLS